VTPRLRLLRCSDVSFGSNHDLTSSTPMSASTSSGLSLHLALVRVVPQRDLSGCSKVCGQNWRLIEHFIGAREQCRWNFEA
jgi:hypothetical protein